MFFFSSRRRHTRCALLTGVQTCALPISCLRDCGGHRALLIRPSEEVDRSERRRSAGLDLDQEVCALVLDGLEGSDRTTELLPDLGIVDGHLEGTGCAPDLLARERCSDEIADMPENLRDVSTDAEARHRGEAESGEGP